MSQKRKSVSRDVLKVEEFKMAFEEEKPFVRRKQLQKQEDWFILPQILELEVDSTISSKSNGLMDEEYDSRNLHTMPDKFI